MDEKDFADTDPFALFAEWMTSAEQSELNDPNAVALATSTPDGLPSVRMVLMKSVSDGGFCFFTNEGSEKGQQLQANPRAAMCFHWKSLRRQIRLEGKIESMSDGAVDDYFHSRSRRSQLGAAVSHQSQPLASREVLEAAVQHFAEQYPEQIPRPSFWRGYRLMPERIEFWMDGPDRLHDRFVFTRGGGTWSAQRLYP